MNEVHEQLSLDNEFAFVEEIQVYKENSDEWIRPQHQSHVRVFYLQHKNPASEILRKELDETVRSSSIENPSSSIRRQQRQGNARHSGGETMIPG